MDKVTILEVKSLDNPGLGGHPGQEVQMTLMTWAGPQSQRIQVPRTILHAVEGARSRDKQSVWFGVSQLNRLRPDRMTSLHTFAPTEARI